MDAQRYAKLHELFVEAAALDGERRGALLARVRCTDSELADELAEMFASDAQSEVASGGRALLADNALARARDLAERLVVDSQVPGWTPERIAGFRIVKRIGEGGMGVVFEAEQDAPRRRVALKMMHPTLTSSERARRFELEAEVLGRLHHPGIAQIYECGTFDLGRGRQPYFAMELVDGVDLRNYAERARLDIDARLALVALVADAVQHAHERGVVHRDLKPDNVLVDAAGTPKVLDFGVARASDTSQLLSTMVTQTGELIGTLAYMAPEQLSGKHEAITPKVDVYALGVILYQLLSGRLPHEVSGLPITAAMRVLAHNEPATLSRLNPRTRGDVETIVAKALETDPARRYGSAAALASDIRRYLDQMPISARPASATYRLRKLLHRNRALAISVFAVIACLSLGLAGTVWQARIAAAERDSAREAARVNEQLAKSEASAHADADRDAAAARAAESLALRKAYSANMLAASDSLERLQFASARSYLDAAPESLRGWEWRVASAQLDTSVRTHPHSLPKVLPADDMWSLALLVSPDRSWYSTVDRRGIPGIDRWDARTGAHLGSCRRAPSDVSANACIHGLELAPDGVHLAMAYVSNLGQRGATAQLELWNVMTGTLDGHWTRSEVPSLSSADLQEVYPSPDGRRVVLLGSSQIAVWDTHTGQLSGPVTTGERIFRAKFSPDGAHIALFGSTASVVILDSSDLSEAFRLPGQRNVGTSFVFSADSRTLFASSIDGAARAWRLDDGPLRCAAMFDVGSQVQNLQLSPDEKLLATISIDRVLRVFDVVTGKKVGEFTSDTLQSYAVAFLGPNEVGGLEADGTLRSWSVGSVSRGVLRGHASFAYDVGQLERDGLIVSGGWDGWQGSRGALRFWDAESGVEVARCLDLDEYVLSLAVAPAHSIVAVSVSQSTGAKVSSRVEFFDLRRGTRDSIAQVDCPPGSVGELAERATVMGLAASPDGSQFAFLRGDTLCLVDSAQRSTLREAVIDPGRRLHGLAWSHDGRRIAACGTKMLGTRPPTALDTLVVDANTLAIERRLAEDGALAVAFSPDDARVATAGIDGLVRVFDAATGEQLAAMTGHDSGVLCVAFSPDGQRLASGGLDRCVRIWDTRSFDPVARLGGYDDYVRSVSWSENGARLLTASGDGSVRVWDSESARARAEALERREQALPEIEALVAKLFEELREAPRVFERIAGDTKLSELERKLARQIALRRSLER